VRALNAGAKKGGFAHDTGEGGVSPYHRENGGDLIWEIGSGYFGCRNRDGSFNSEEFARVASDDQIKMVELKVSQGAKPGHGGVLPAAKVSEEISKIRGVSMDEDCISPASHGAFSTPLEMMAFIGEMRRLSGGKPAGFKLCIGHPWEFLAICKAMIQTGIYPDFIVVDGNEGGTGAAPLEFMDHLGMPMREGVSFVHNALVGINARDRIRIGAPARSPPLSTWRARWRSVPIGAIRRAVSCFRWAASSPELPYRSMPDRRDHARSIPQSRAGGAAQDRAGFQLSPRHAACAGRTARGRRARNIRRTSGRSISRRGPRTTEVRSFAQLYPSLRPGELIDGTSDPRFRDAWAMARAESFSMVGSSPSLMRILETEHLGLFVIGE